MAGVPPRQAASCIAIPHFATVSAAVNAARPGDWILVRPGLYQEGVIVDKPLEILGDGPVADIEIQARDAHAVRLAPVTRSDLAAYQGQRRIADLRDPPVKRMPKLSSLRSRCRLP